MQNGCLRKPYKGLRKRREVKGKGEKERYNHLNAEFQRIAGEIRKPSSMINAKKQKIFRRGDKNTQKNYTKKNLHDPDNHDGVITFLEPDILECEVKMPYQASLQTKLVEVMEFQLSYFKF